MFWGEHESHEPKVAQVNDTNLAGCVVAYRIRMTRIPCGGCDR